MILEFKCNCDGGHIPEGGFAEKTVAISPFQLIFSIEKFIINPTVKPLTELHYLVGAHICVNVISLKEIHNWIFS